jgi:hypothetical protein
MFWHNVTSILIVPEHVGELHTHIVHALVGQLPYVIGSDAGIPNKKIFIFNNNEFTKFKPKLKQGIQEWK